MLRRLISTFFQERPKPRTQTEELMLSLEDRGISCMVDGLGVAEPFSSRLAFDPALDVAFLFGSRSIYFSRNTLLQITTDNYLMFGEGSVTKTLPDGTPILRFEIDQLIVRTIHPLPSNKKAIPSSSLR